MEGSGNGLGGGGTAYAQRTKHQEVHSWCLEGTEDGQDEQDVTNTSLEARTSQVTHEKMTSSGDFHGGPGIKNPPSSAGDASSIPGRGTTIPHAVWQLNPHS